MATRKLPIAETAMDAIRFGLTRAGTAARLGLLPCILYGLLLGCGLFLVISAFPQANLILAEVFKALESATGQDLDLGYNLTSLFDEPDAARMLVGGALMIVSVLVFVPVMTALLQVAAGDEDAPRTWLYFRWGDREWRTLIVFIGLMIAVLAANQAIGVIMIVAVAGAAMVDGGMLLTGLLAGTAVLLSFCFYIWLNMRISLIVPAVAIENETNLLEAFGATAGNVFRILGSLILLGLTLFLLMLAALLVGGIVGVLLSLFVGQVGTETSLGLMVSVFGGVALVGFGVYACLVLALSQLGWYGLAWAALRPDHVGVCGPDGPRNGEVCEI